VKRANPLLLAACSVALLAACSTFGEVDVEPPPLALAPVPDTTVLGAAALPGSVAGATLANCGFRGLAEEVLQRINAVRASGHRCGRRSMGPAAPVRWDAGLYAAAANHSFDMATRNYFDHRSPEGATVRTRASAVSPQHWKTLGENIAGGDRSLAQVMQAWLESSQHCENMLDPEFQDVAVACAAQPGSEWGMYWTMVLGRRR
jgi:uncharacterized protein YkwD